jgi:uncharacterized protein (TIGR03437 family)
VKRDCNIQAITLDAGGNLFATGSGRSVPTTAGAFQAAMQPVFPALPQADHTPFEAFIIKFDFALSRIIAATLLAGESGDQGASIAIGSGGTVIVAGSTSSKAFPTRAPFQSSFSDVSGFVARLDPGLSSLLFATFVGDRRYFELKAAYPDQNGDILLTGSTLLPTSGTICLPILPVQCLSAGNTVFANKISLSPVPAVRLDSAQNAANQLATPLSPGERIALTGAGFGPDAQLLLNGSPVQTTFQTANRLVALLPSQLGDASAAVLTISSKGSISNSVVAPIAASSPGIYSADGSGYGQGYILNSDGTLNSPSNPAPTRSAITMFLTGIGSYTLDGIYAVAAQPVSVFIDGFYADGIAATLQQVPGVPGDTYALSVYIPNPADYASQNPNLKDYKMPPQVGLVLVSGPVRAVNPDYSAAHTQPGLSLSIKQ